MLPLAVLKHVRNWSFEETEQEVRANVVNRQFTRIGPEKVPNAKTSGRLLQALGPAVKALKREEICTNEYGDLQHPGRTDRRVHRKLIQSLSPPDVHRLHFKVVHHADEPIRVG